MDLDVPAYSSVVLALPADLARPDEGRRELLVAEAGDTAERALWFFAEDRDVDWPAAAWDATVEPVDGGQRVRVTARTVLRDLTLFPDRLDPAASGGQGAGHPAARRVATFTVRARRAAGRRRR